MGPPRRRAFAGTVPVRNPVAWMASEVGRRAAVVLSAMLMAAALAACATAPSSPLVLIPEPERQPAPTIAGPGLRGGVVRSTDVIGRPMLVNAFASWCRPCQVELPMLADAHDSGLVVLGIDVQDVDEAAIGTLEAAGATFPVIKDPRGDLLASLRTPAVGIPQSILIDARGRVAGYVIGPIDTTTLAAIRLELSKAIDDQASTG